MAGKSLIKPRKTIPIKESMDEAKQIKEKFDTLTKPVQLKLLAELGVGERFFTCQRCGKVKHKEDFYQSTATEVESHITNICRACAEEAAQPVDVNGKKKELTKESMDYALFLLDKPMLDSVWEASVKEAKGASSINSVYGCYMKNISMPQYYSFTYKSSDNYTSGMLTLGDMLNKAETTKDVEITEQFEKNKNDTLRLLGYLPFENEKLTSQPFLYSQLIGFLDSSEEGNDDMMRIQSIISIVRGFAQASTIDDNIAKLSADAKIAERNVSTIKAYQAMKRDIMTSVVNLAKENCISLKNSKNSVKGENTWTGKVKKIKDLNLRDGEVNGFDIATCRGMMQVQEISDASIMKQLALDESEWSDIVATMRTDLQEIRHQRDSYQEINRILLKENIDLRDYLEDNGIRLNKELISLKELYSPFATMSDEEDLDYEEDDEEYEEEVDFDDGSKSISSNE